MKTDKLSILLLVAVALWALAGCAMPTAPAASSGAETGAGSAPVEVKIWHMEQPPHRVERIQQLIDEFNAANPGIVVSQEPQNWGEIYTKAPAAVAAGSGQARR